MKYAIPAWLLIGFLFCTLPLPAQRAAAHPGPHLVTLRPGAEASAAPATSRFTIAAAQPGLALVPHPATPELGDGTCLAVALGDLDVDGDLDALVAGDTYQPSTIWLNDGAGAFSPQPLTPTLSISDTVDVALGDLDLDGDLDALLANNHDQPQTVWLNDGTGGFHRHDAFGAGNSYAVALGDLDGDGDLDAVLVDFLEGSHTVWLNDGTGHFAPHPTLPIFANGCDPLDIALGDLDGDGDLDALVISDICTERVWLNDGSGAFHSHGSFDAGDSFGGDLGDVDADGDLDAVVSQHGPLVLPAPPVWLNDGAANFGPHPVPSTFGPQSDAEVALGDMDGDGDLDAVVVAGHGRPNRVSLNDGTGHFVTHATFGGGDGYQVALGDLDGDGDLDALVANGSSAQVWLNVPAWRIYLPLLLRGT
jgi:hypothetical protein